MPMPTPTETFTAHADGLSAVERRTFNEIDSVDLPPADVFAFNELRSCADLYRMYRNGQLHIQPTFQREIVWKKPAQTRFIDSLAKNLPIPSMCFSMDFNSDDWQVIDGQQRMWTIIKFLQGNWTLSSLDDVDKVLSGVHVPDREHGCLGGSPEFLRYYRRIEDTTLPITVLRCNTSDPIHMEYLFTIFHRLNTGGKSLNNQEIRNCIFSGPFNDLLQTLDCDPNWLNINGRSPNGQHRFRGQEIILRFFAFHDSLHTYGSSLVGFLNDYMREHRHPGDEFIEAKHKLFVQTAETVWHKVYGEIHEPGPISLLEAVLVGVAANLTSVSARSPEEGSKMLKNLRNSEAFSEEALREGLSRRDKVQSRIETAMNVFAGCSRD